MCIIPWLQLRVRVKNEGFCCIFSSHATGAADLKFPLRFKWSHGQLLLKYSQNEGFCFGHTQLERHTENFRMPGHIQLEARVSKNGKVEPGGS